MIEKKPSITVAIPHTGNIRAELFERMLTLETYGHRVAIFPSWGRPITENRNQIVKRFLQSKFDFLLQIDSDICPPQNIIRMVENDLDICSADIYTVKGFGAIRLGMIKVGETYQTKKGLKEGAINEVDATGTGCFLVKREVFLKVGGFQTGSEDFNFCERAREKGYKIYYDTRYRCRHHTVVPI